MSLISTPKAKLLFHACTDTLVLLIALITIFCVYYDVILTNSAHQQDSCSMMMHVNVHHKRDNYFCM